MSVTRLSSGRFDVDRRLQYAEGCAAVGDISAAVEILRDAMSLVPDWAPGWFRLGEWHEALGQIDEASDAWDRALRADPADRMGAGLKRDLLRRVPVAETLPAAFVEALFDQYAPRFEASLRDKLGYRAPEKLVEALPSRRFDRVLDLGCGTGLVAEVLGDRAGWIGGYDLSQGMLDLAAAKGLYNRLRKHDVTRLKLGRARYDLIVAADVFNYIGALERVVAWCAGSLRPGGVLAFTVERGDDAVMLRDSRRFAHSADYLMGLLGDAGLCSVRLKDVVLRQDRGVDVIGLIVVAERAPSTVDRLCDGDDLVTA